MYNTVSQVGFNWPDEGRIKNSKRKFKGALSQAVSVYSSQ